MDYTETLKREWIMGVAQNIFPNLIAPIDRFKNENVINDLVNESFRIAELFVDGSQRYTKGK